MATSIKTIKSQLTDDTIYPITKANAVYLANSTAETVDGHLTNLEDKVGTATLSTTAQNLCGAVNELNTKLGNTSISGIGNGTVTGAISALKDKYVTVIYSGDLGVLSAGASGYATASVVIPSGYITTGIANSVLGHPGVAGGLSINTGVASQLSGTITFYPAYYTPKAITNGNADYKIYILCVKENLL